MGLFDFRSPAQKKEAEERYAEMIFPRGMQVQEEIYALIAKLCPKSGANWVMLGFITGKEGVQKLRARAMRDGLPAPTQEAERAAALKRMNPRRSKLNRYETAVALALVFADLAADEGQPMASAEELKAQIEREKSAALPLYSAKK